MELRDFIYVKDAVIPLNALSSLLKWMNKKSDLFQDAAVISQNSDLLVDTSIRKVKNFFLSIFIVKNFYL